MRRQFGQFWRRAAPAPADRPFRDELLSVERLEERALALAASFTIDPRARARPIFPRFDDNARVLRAAYRTLADDVRTGRFFTAAAEWLLDNFHLVTSRDRATSASICRGTYYRQLPTLASREQQRARARSTRWPSSWCATATAGSTASSSTVFLNSYQRVAPLTIGELWAWPSMLKLALIENLRRLADEMLEARARAWRADAYSRDRRGPRRRRRWPWPAGDRTSRRSSSSCIAFARVRPSTVVAPHGGRGAPRRARTRPPKTAIRSEHQRQAAAQVSVANAITSLRLCSALDWREYVESVSLVEQVLQRDPGRRLRTDGLPQPRSTAPGGRGARGAERRRAGAGRAEGGRKRPRRRPATRIAADRAAHVGYHLIGRGRARPRGRRRLSAAARAARPAPGVRARDAPLPGPDRDR